MHLLIMLGFVIFVAVVFASVSPEATTLESRIIYGLKVFGSFIGIGLAIATIFYFF